MSSTESSPEEPPEQPSQQEEERENEIKFVETPEGTNLIIPPKTLYESVASPATEMYDIPEYEGTPMMATVPPSPPRDLEQDIEMRQMPEIKGESLMAAPAKESYRKPDIPFVARMGKPAYAVYEVPEANSVEEKSDAIDSGEAEGNRLTENVPEDVETSMNKALAKGDFDKITDVITPYNLTRCKINSLEKSFEVSYRLKCLAKRGGPDAGDFNDLANTIEKFSLELIEPLKNHDMSRAIFTEGNNFDQIAEKLVLFEQKKFVSHPVVYNLLMRRWTGRFYQYRYNSAMTWNWFKWILLNLWTFFDWVLFPFVFLFFGLVHKAIGAVKRRQDHCVVMVLNATWKEEYWERIRVLVSDIIDHCDIKRIKYGSFIRLRDGIVTNSAMDKDGAKTALMNKTVCVKTEKDPLESCLKNGKEMLKRCKGPNSNKTLVVMMDDKFKDSFENCRQEIHEIKSLGHRVICVGLGVNFDIKELESMATDGNVFLYHGDTKQKDVREKVLEGIHGHDIYDRYVQYFNTPYFIFVRDTLSYLVLLGLHCATCLQPSTIEFSSFEWLILFFFIGRLLMEVYQAVIEKHLENKIRKSSSKSKETLQNNSKQERAPLEEGSSTKGDKEKVEVKVVGLTKQKSRAMSQALFSTISRYFSDWWNALDLITLLVYIVILILRSITWAEHLTVPNNRLLAVAGYFYGLNTMFLTLRVFGHIMESMKKTGSIQIALFQIIGAVLAIFGQFIAAVLAFSLAITKIYVAEMSYSGGKQNSTSHGFCESGKSGAACWWKSMIHLLWSLLGIAELDPLQSPDGASDILAKLLYGVFLIMAVVMMMNMMIALLSNTYQQVEDNAFYEWSYRKATTIRTYINYHPVPVPFNIISLACLVVWHIYMRLCYIRCGQSSGSKEREEQEAEKQRILKQDDAANKSEEKEDAEKKSNRKKNKDKMFKTFFDSLVYDLQAEYFAGHGYAFPMEDSNKIDLLLKETEGCHQFMGHITSQVYKYTTNEATTLENKIGSHSCIWRTSGVDIKGNQLTYAPCICPDCKRKSDQEQPQNHGAQFQVPLSWDWPGFEVLIQEIGDRHFIALGVVPDGHDAHKFPGWEGNSAGYHVDDGRIYDRNDSTLGRECEGAVAKRGDLITCKILFDQQEDGGILPVSISLNGQFLGQAKVKGLTRVSRDLWKIKDFYPFIGIGWEGVTLLFKLISRDQQSNHFLNSEVDLVRTHRREMSDLRAQVSDLQNQVQDLRSDVSLIKNRIVYLTDTISFQISEDNTE